MEMESELLEAGKEFVETRSKSQEKEEEMISIPSSTVMKSKNDEGNTATASPSLVTAQINPLLIDLILESTLSKLSLGDLLSCRLVCRQWNRISTPKVRAKCTELIFSSEDPTGFVPYHNRSPPWNYFLPTMENSLSIPCTKFQLQLYPDDPNLSCFRKLIDVCSNEITSLHLGPLGLEYDSVTLPAPDSNKATFQNWLKKLKNLTKLTITDFDFGILSCSSFFEPGNELNLDNLREFHFLGVGTSENLSSGFFDGFFKAAQNLEKMSFGVKDHRLEYEQEYPKPDDFEDSSDEERQLQAYENEHVLMPEFLRMNDDEASEGLNVVLNSLLNHGRLDEIKSLFFHNLNTINLAILVEIGKKGLKLELFQVVGRIYFGPVGLYLFLETQEDSLKTLEIYGAGDPPETFLLRFPPQMKELRRLTLSNDGPLNMYNEPISYASRFPKLRTLRVRSGHQRRDYRQTTGILNVFLPKVKNLVGCETLKELRMFFISDDEPRIKEDEIIQRVSRVFPEMAIRVRVDRAEEDDDNEEILENGRAREMTLKIFGD